ncbi:MAG: hypothetical protein U0271_45170 [Polyangiaceae bacterium]
MRVVGAALALPLMGSGLWGCGVGVSQEWSLRHPEPAPRVSRIGVSNAIVEQGVMVGAGATLVEDRDGVAVKSGDLHAGFGWSDLAEGECCDGSCALGVNLLGVLDVGLPPIATAKDVTAGLGGRAEIVLIQGRNREQELELFGFRFELVGTVDMRFWVVDGPGWFELTTGLGLRVAFVSEAGPPFARWLKALLP